jgi:uncharacterized membrane protein
MKTVKTLLVVMAMAVMAIAGCESPRGGGMSGGEGFKIGTPTFTAQIKQGETENVKISLNRGKYFKRDVTLEIMASKGISVEPTQAFVGGNDTPDVNLRVTAAKDANLGEYKVYVKGTPEQGESTSTEITVKVVAP